MGYPNTYIFVDLPSTDPAATATFYANVFGWDVEGRPQDLFHRAVPGDEFLKDGEPSGVGNLHLGIYNVADGRPNPNGYDDHSLAVGRGIRVYILVSDDDNEDAILERAAANGAEILWRHHYWEEFNGFNGAFRDPWGNEIVLWSKAGDEPQIPEGYTRG